MEDCAFIRPSPAGGHLGGVARHTRALFHYSLDGTADGYALRAMSGVETVLPLSPRASANLSAARLDTARGDDSLDYTALAGGYSHQDEGTGQFNIDDDRSPEGGVLSLGVDGLDDVAQRFPQEVRGVRDGVPGRIDEEPELVALAQLGEGL